METIMLKRALIIVLLLACIGSADAKIKIPEKLKNLKKPPPEKPYMVETYDEWLEKAQDIELGKRIYEPQKPQVNEKLNKVEPPVILFSRYNVPPGSNEADLAAIRRELVTKSIPVASADFSKLAVAFYYYAPMYNQISSEVLVVPLDTSKSRIDRILEAKILDYQKGYNLTSGAHEFLKDLYSTLTIVDWSPNGKIVLVKEKIGSPTSGIFRTNLWAIFLDEGVNKSGGITSRYKNYPDLQSTIIKYWKKQNKIILDSYRWDVKVLGFSSANPNLAVVSAHVYDNKGEKISLGTWSVDVYTGDVRLVSTKNEPQGISTNGMVLKLRTE